MNRLGMTRGAAIALLTFVSLAALGVGIAVDRLVLQSHRVDERRTSGSRGGGRPPFGPPGRESRGMRERFARELDLSPQQAARIDSIMEQQMADFRRLRDEMQPRFDSLLAKAQLRIDSLLTPAQRERLKLLREREVFGPRGGFGPPPERRPPHF